jgi:DNA-binding NarL/FixJ family response regulator
MLTFNSIDRVLSPSEQHQLANILSAGAEYVLLEHKPGNIKLKPVVAKTGNAADVLSERQRQILYLIQKGKTNQEISEILQVTRKNVKYHIERILQKLKVGNRAQAIAKAVELQIAIAPI